MKLLVRYRNKEIAISELEDGSFMAPSGVRHGFYEIGKAKDGGQPVVVNLDDVIALEPWPDDSGSSGVA
jgi:hypothetical protein